MSLMNVKKYNFLKYVFGIMLTLCVGVNASAEPIRIGAIVPLSGIVAPWGERVRIGLETANQLQGNPYKIIFEDEGACEAQKALSAYRKLVNVDQVKIIIVSCLSGIEAIVPVASRESVLLLSLGLLSDSSLKSGAKLVNLATEIGTEATFLSEYVKREKPNNPAGIFFADAFGQEFSRKLSESLKEFGTPFVATDDAEALTQTFRSLIMRWKNRNVDLLVTTLADKQQVTLLQEMQQLRFKPKIFSSYILECFAPSPADRKNFEGIKYTHPVNSAEGSVELNEFNAALGKKEKPGQNSNINALFAYDGLKLLSKGVEKCGETDVACLYSYFTTLGLQHGVSGEMRFEVTGKLKRPYGLKTVLNGEFVWLEKRGL